MNTLFPLDVAPPRMPSGPILRSARIDGDYRWELRRQWGPGPCIFWGMLNPSTADGLGDDPTVRTIIGFSFRWGYGSLIVGNIYPFRSSKTAALRKWRTSALGTGEINYIARDAFIRNAGECATALAECETAIAAWGAMAEEDDVDAWLENVGARIDHELDWNCLGKTLSGAPKHPLARGTHRIPDDQKPVLWRTV